MKITWWSASWRSPRTTAWTRRTAGVPKPLGIRVKSNVRPGKVIQPGDLLFVLGAMKMETEIPAPIGGKVAEVRANVGESVKSGQVVLSWV